ncbi:MAG TPA: 16S rRNA (cytosine(1402)-N(4))-methyltransferase RsmH [Acidimicrobiales bacterium]|jgi:16S rRNA (cytosine1402-N4)-methyltransferase|nr:16S rRNA (cytosine(1402)-N(4))-methyltransferase RsmH [Acidimicrobiales bacterium]
MAPSRTSPAGEFRHEPVLVERVLEVFAEVPPGLVVDGTLGAAGHASALLRARDDIALLGIDRDPVALRAASRTLERFSGRSRLARARFDSLAALATTTAAELGVPITGVLLDLGVSSPQFDDADRGFSYRFDAPLDMRMDPDQRFSADDVVNGYDAAELARIIEAHADERFARRIADAVVAARPVRTTGALADAIRDAMPAAARRRRGHPAKRTFQAIRIEVNDELRVLAASLSPAIDVLAPGGRIAVISYHSGEDRIVKDAFRQAVTGGCICPPQLPCVCGAVPVARTIGRQGARPTADEVTRNPRAESARLRVLQKLTPDEARAAVEGR